MTRQLSVLGLLAIAGMFCVWQAAANSGVPLEPQEAPKAPDITFASNIRPFLVQHCFHCHGNGKSKGGLSLDKFTDDESVQRNRPVWEHVLHMLGTKQMPPKERPRPEVAETTKVLAAIEHVMNNIDCSKIRNVGRVTLRRLNRNEYNNTIRDLVGIDFKPAADFPADDVGYGFDNIGDVLTMSPLLLEKYLAAAESILDKAIVIADPPKATQQKLGAFRFTFGAGDVIKGGGGYLHSQGDMWTQAVFEEGDYTIRAEVYAQPAGDEPVRGALRVNRADLKAFELKDSSPITVEAKMRFTTETNRIAVAFHNPFTDPKEKDPKKQKRLLYVRSIVVDGPYNPPPPKLPETHTRIMATKAGTAPNAGTAPKAGLAPREAARQIVGRFAGRAFRRPVSPAEVDRLLTLFDKSQKDGERFENSVKLALYRVLVSPHFLFRVELDPPDAKPQAAYKISEFELATRLSYFLWSSMPDDELFALAEKGQLRHNLESQMRRMLKDQKSAAFTQNFAGQWLTLRNLANINPDPKVFPTFNDELRAAMQRETELFFDAVLREDRSILDFIDADFSFVNERLAKHYGIEGVKGKAFQKVKLPANRGGILTHASILTLTSYPTRTSPVLRGKWVLEQILNTPPPPPPPDVPNLDEERQLKGSLRQVMEMHRTNAICASCHQRMDPIGFAFENYDALGRWRDKDGKFDIDPSGVLPDGKSFRGPAELKAILKDKKDLFARCLSEKILTYALGRGLEFYDKCAVDKVLEALAKNNYRFSTLLLEVAKSEPFQMRTATGKR